MINTNANKMQEVKLDKIVINIAVGGDEAKLVKALKLLEIITGRKPVKTLARKRIAAFKIRPGLPIGAKVTLRNKAAREILVRMLGAVDNKVGRRQFGDGGFSFGIKEYIQIPNVGYQRDVGLIGMDVSAVFRKAGYRVVERKIKRGRLPRRQRVSKQEVMDYAQKNFEVQIVEAREK